jgi:hypothetical protein
VLDSVGLAHRIRTVLTAILTVLAASNAVPPTLPASNENRLATTTTLASASSVPVTHNGVGRRLDDTVGRVASRVCHVAE